MVDDFVPRINRAGGHTADHCNAIHTRSGSKPGEEFEGSMMLRLRPHKIPALVLRLLTKGVRLLAYFTAEAGDSRDLFSRINSLRSLAPLHLYSEDIFRGNRCFFITDGS